MTTMAEMWKNASTLEDRIEDIYSRLKNGQSILDDILIARAEITQVKEDIDILMAYLLQKKEWGSEIIM